MQVQSLTPHLGAIVQGIDLSEPMSDSAASQALKAVYLDYSVLVFPDQALSQAQHKAFASRFGALAHPPDARPTAEGRSAHFTSRNQCAISLYRRRGLAYGCHVRCAATTMLAIVCHSRRPGKVAGTRCLLICILAFELLSDPMKAVFVGAHGGARWRVALCWRL